MRLFVHPTSLLAVFGISLSVVHLRAASAEGCETTEFDDELNWGRPMPEWPVGFGERLDVIKFNYTRNPQTGLAVIGSNNSVDSYRICCVFCFLCCIRVLCMCCRLLRTRWLFIPPSLVPMRTFLPFVE